MKSLPLKHRTLVQAFFFLMESIKKRFNFVYSIPEYFTLCTTRTAQKLLFQWPIPWVLISLCPVVLIFYEKEAILSIALPASSLNVECCLFKTQGLSAPKPSVKWLAVVCVCSCLLQWWASSQTHDCLQRLSRQNENIINQYPTTAVFDKFLSDA